MNLNQVTAGLPRAAPVYINIIYSRVRVAACLEFMLVCQSMQSLETTDRRASVRKQTHINERHVLVKFVEGPPRHARSFESNPFLMDRGEKGGVDSSRFFVDVLGLGTSSGTWLVASG